MEYHDIGENIRKYRKRLKLTQDELADKVGITWEMISRYERGESSPMNQIDKLANALSVSAGDLVDGDSVNVFQVPLFTSVPKDLVFKKENTLTYYNCPTWVTRLDHESFVVDMGVVKFSSLLSASNGFLFVSPNCELCVDDIVLVSRDGKLRVESYNKRENSVIGKVVMQEVVY
ncbi:helix-turn-helix domain-containing protein [bacterium]|nr:helix-turn-helix domain-containing protein [bacterium]